MDRALIISYLQSAEEQVANGDRQIARHCDLISTLERAGHDTTSAIALLRELKQMQVQHVAERDRLRDELAVLSAAQLGNRNEFVVRPMGVGECSTQTIVYTRPACSTTASYSSHPVVERRCKLARQSFATR